MYHKDTKCNLFTYNNLRSDPISSQKDNILIYTIYSINSCRPCPPGFKKNEKNKSGICSVPIYSYYIIYENFINYNINPSYVKYITMTQNAAEKADMEFNVGRNETSDINTDIINSTGQIHSEIFILPLSLRRSGIFMRQYIDNEKFWLFITQKFKTTANAQIKSMSDIYSLTERSTTGYYFSYDVPNYIEKFIKNIQKNFSNFFKSEKNYENIDLLYSLIPNENNLIEFINDIEKVQKLGSNFKLNFQTRD